MKKKLALILLPLFLLSSALWGRDKTDVDFFVRVVARPSEVIVGDSTLVSYVLYATAPFSDISEKSDKFKVRGANVRRIRYRSGTSRVVENGKVYYSMVGAQYVVAPDAVGKISIPSCAFEAVFRFRRSSGHPLEEFFGYGGKVIEVKQTAKSDALEITVKEKPRRTTREMMREGVI